MPEVTRRAAMKAMGAVVAVAAVGPVAALAKPAFDPAEYVAALEAAHHRVFAVVKDGALYSTNEQFPVGDDPRPNEEQMRRYYAVKRLCHEDADVNPSRGW